MSLIRTFHGRTALFMVVAAALATFGSYANLCAAPLNLTTGTKTLTMDEDVMGGTWSDGALDVDTFDLTNLSGFTLDFVPTGGNSGPLSGSGGRLVNQAGATFLMNHQGAGGPTFNRNLNVTGNVTFLNEGVFRFDPSGTTSEKHVVLEDPGTTFTNLGIVEQTSGTKTSSILGDGGTSGTFDNQGFVSVTSGRLNLEIDDASSGSAVRALTLPQVSGSTLTGGSWEASGSGEFAIGSAPSFTTIGSGATVILGDTGRFFGVNDGSDNLSVTNVQGRLFSNSGKTLIPSGSLAVASTGTVGGNGAFGGTVNVAGHVSPGETSTATGGQSTIGTLTLSTLNLQDGATLDLQISDPNGTPGIDSDLIAVLNNLTLPGAGETVNVDVTLPDGFAEDFGPVQITDIGGALLDFEDTNFAVGFNSPYFGTITSDGDNLFLNGIAITPEPASVMFWGLLAVVGLGLRQWRKSRLMCRAA